MDLIRLFKYLTVDSSKLVLQNQTLRFSPLSSFNDPFEGENIFSFEVDPTTGCVEVMGEDGKMLKLGHEPNLVAVELARDQISKHSACCFCDRVDSTLLWSHYAANHTGVCLEFEVEEFSNGRDIFNLPCGSVLPFGRVNYSRLRPTILLNTKTSSDVPYELIDLSAMTKSLDWQYEGEWRFLKRCSPSVEYLTFRSESLKRAIVGIKCDPADIAAIHQILKRNYPVATLAWAKKHATDYSVVVSEVP